MSDYIIRAAKKSDAEAYRVLRLSALENNPEAFGSSYEESQLLDVDYFRNRIPDSASENLMIVLDSGTELLGMMGFMRYDRLKKRHASVISGIYLEPNARGQGFAKKMLAHIMEHAKGLEGLRQIQLSVTAGNQAAIKLYESFGFTIWGTEAESSYVGGIYYDQHHMACLLSEASHDR